MEWAPLKGTKHKAIQDALPTCRSYTLYIYISFAKLIHTSSESMPNMEEHFKRHCCVIKSLFHIPDIPSSFAVEHNDVAPLLF
jgi:hypothetical protein